MLQKSGYMQVSKAPAYDPSGRKCRIIEISVDEGLLAIEAGELSKVLRYGRRCRISRLVHNFGKHIGDYAGTASLSHSEKGLVLDISPGRKYMVSRTGAANLLAGYSKYTTLAVITNTAGPVVHNYGGPTIQSTITPWVAV